MRPGELSEPAVGGVGASAPHRHTHPDGLFVRQDRPVSRLRSGEDDRLGSVPAPSGSVGRPLIAEGHVGHSHAVEHPVRVDAAIGTHSGPHHVGRSSTPGSKEAGGGGRPSAGGCWPTSTRTHHAAAAQRTNQHFTLKQNPLRRHHLDESLEDLDNLPTPEVIGRSWGT
jgi:hypothetical protein